MLHSGFKRQLSLHSAKAAFSLAFLFGTGPLLCALPPTATAEKAHNSSFTPARLRLNSLLGDNMAYQVGADVCCKGMGVVGSWGLSLTDADLVKISAQHRVDKLKFNFTGPSTEKKSTHQTAFGVAYQRNVDLGRVSSIDVTGGWSEATGKDLADDGYVQRHLAGTQFYGATVGATMSAWESASAHFALNYDYVHIHRKYHDHRKGSGLGVSARLVQAINSELSLEAKVELRRIFNVYGAGLNYTGLHKDWTVGVFAESVRSTYNLPNTSSIGLNITYTLGADGANEPAKLVGWVNIPAFSQPEVLVATDELSMPD